MPCIATMEDYRRIPEHLHYVLDALCGSGEDWLDAIEGIGVRPMYYNGSHCAYLGKNMETNAVVARFTDRASCEKWCKRVNEQTDN